MVGFFYRREGSWLHGEDVSVVGSRAQVKLLPSTSEISDSVRLNQPVP